MLTSPARLLAALVPWVAWVPLLPESGMSVPTRTERRLLSSWRRKATLRSVRLPLAPEE